MKASFAGAAKRRSTEVARRVRRQIVEHGLISPGERVLAAVSGGADSTCLLIVLAALRTKLDFELQAAYFDHMLRGRRAIEREQRFLRGLCQELDIRLQTGAADVRAYKEKEHASPEDAARQLRYRFLGGVARDQGCDVVATGHTLDDQAETVLMHVVRGAGLRGLSGMAPASALPYTTGDALLVRPLLSLRRSDTERCCTDAGVTPMDDATNRSLGPLRNRVRMELLPMLHAYNPQIEHALVRLAGAAKDYDATMREIATAWMTQGTSRDGTVRLPRTGFCALPAGLQSYVVQAAVAKVLGDTQALSERHIQAVVAAARTTGATLDLPRGLTVEVQPRTVILRPGHLPTTRMPTRRQRLVVPGVTRFGPWQITVDVIDGRPTRLRSRNRAMAQVDADAAGAPMWLRGRRPGDRFQPLGLQESKKLQDVLVDGHVPRSERDLLPLVCGRRGILWAPGSPPAEWAKIHAGTRRTLRLVAERDLTP